MIATPLVKSDADCRRHLRFFEYIEIPLHDDLFQLTNLATPDVYEVAPTLSRHSLESHQRSWTPAGSVRKNPTIITNHNL